MKRGNVLFICNLIAIICTFLVSYIFIYPNIPFDIIGTIHKNDVKLMYVTVPNKELAISIAL